MILSSRNIAWAAGFIEGEGSFALAAKSQPMVTVSQMQKEPLERLAKMFGGTVKQHWKKGYKTGYIWQWDIYSRRAAAVIMTIFSFMSPKRKDQMLKVLDGWKAAPSAHGGPQYKYAWGPA